MIIVRTPTGARTHLAMERTCPRTLCGREFSDGFDEVSEAPLIGILTATSPPLCEACRAVQYRRSSR